VDYSTLVKTIKSYVENDFPPTLDTSGLTTAEQLSTFVRQAEQRIYNSVQLLDLRKSVTGTVTAGNKYLTVPTDWLATFSIAVTDSDGAEQFLINKDVNFIRAAYPIATDTGLPQYYSFFDKDSFILAPTPDSNYTVELHYFYYPNSIVDDGTSWLGNNFDSALLYGALLEANTFIKGEADVMAIYQARYEEAMNMIKQLAEGKNRQDMFRTQQVRYPVK